ncbi:TRAPPC11 [Cordylochernes scorpioides]|uniref:TRAPPC11 n=1 Tax=Cordylochernes scorpioides TaxID=51811 RepID=A0ABY6L9I4_9ARAC|nr:TRAPPC11 [Cordylochernes scorpioides]
MGHQNIWYSHPRKYGPGSRRVCANHHGIIRKYALCRRCFRQYAADIGFKKLDYGLPSYHNTSHDNHATPLYSTLFCARFHHEEESAPAVVAPPPPLPTPTTHELQSDPDTFEFSTPMEKEN